MLSPGAPSNIPPCLCSARQLLRGVWDGLEGENLPRLRQGKFYIFNLFFTKSLMFSDLFLLNVRCLY